MGYPHFGQGRLGKVGFFVAILWFSFVAIELAEL